MKTYRYRYARYTNTIRLLFIVNRRFLFTILHEEFFFVFRNVGPQISYITVRFTRPHVTRVRRCAFGIISTPVKQTERTRESQKRIQVTIDYVLLSFLFHRSLFVGCPRNILILCTTHRLRSRVLSSETHV